MFYPRATGIGGCTVHNAMITMAGPAADWDELAWFLDDESWSAEVMRGYFQRLERCEYIPRPKRPETRLQRIVETLWWLFGKDEDPTGGRHGFGGWLHTSVVDFSIGLKDKQLVKMLYGAAITSAKEGMEAPKSFVRQALVGDVDEALDPNHQRRQRERPEGVVAIPTAIKGSTSDWPGHRSSPAERLRAVAKDFPDRLVIATDCLCTKIILEPADGRLRATGVEYLHGQRLYKANAIPATTTGQPFKIHARKAVILCGGTFNTPQLLMLSGIGPKEDLEALNIRPPYPIVHSPGVGRNLQDRYEVSVVAKMREPFELLKGKKFNPAIVDDGLTEWRSNGTGLYASNGTVLGVFKRSRPDLAQADLFIFGIPLKFQGYQVGYSVVDPATYDLFTWAILKAHTQNRGGTVRLTSTSPLDMPAINFNYFGSNQPSGKPNDKDPDLEAILQGVKFVRRMIAGAGDVVAAEHYPGASISSDDAIRDWIKNIAWGHHACGTCRMGRPMDPDAVIDSRFRVLEGVDPLFPTRKRRHIKGLCVMDASIFPSIPGDFIVSNIYMASEKAADVIHQDGGC